MRSLVFASSVIAFPALLAAQSGWSPPVLEAALNSTASDAGPHLSADGTTLHFASIRSGTTAGAWEIYSSFRPWSWMPWSPPVLEAALSDPTATDDQPFLSADSTEIWFSRLLAPNGFEIMRAVRAGFGAPWGTPAPVVEVNGTGSESSPSVTADGLELYFLTTSWGAPSAPNNAIFRATRPSTAVPFGTPTVVNEVLTPNTHRDCEVSSDGLSLVYTEFLPAPVSRLRVFEARRTSRSLPFGTPMPLAEFDGVGTSTGVFSFSRSFTGHEAVLAANFGTNGAQELMTTRFEGLTVTNVPTSLAPAAIVYRDSANPNSLYAFGAAFGTTGFPLGTRTVPLDPDFLLSATLGVNFAGFSTGWIGGLDADGIGSGTLANPVPAFAGLVIHVGAFTFVPSAPFGVATISNPVAVQMH